MLTNSGVLKMALYFDDDHLNSSDPNKDSDTKKSNGGIDGVAKKWEQTHAVRKSYNGIGGNSLSRNQGTGELGKEQTIPGEVLDTSKMDPEEKFRYLQALGMLPGKGSVKSSEPAQTPKLNQNRPFRRGR